MSEAIGEVELEDNVLVIRRIHVVLKLKARESDRETANRVHGFFAGKEFRSIFQMDEKLFDKVLLESGQERRFAAGARNPLVLSGLVFAGANLPVVCDGVTVNAQDIVVADSDGVVAVPRARAKEVLALAQEMDFKEHSMYAYIEKLKSIQEAVKKFGRL